jgi:hypothetical protein
MNMNTTKEYTQFFIIIFACNIILAAYMDIKNDLYNYSYNLICLSLGIFNCIIFNDIYFRIKYIKQINHLPLNFYPSNRSFIKYIWYSTSIVFLLSSFYYCLHFWNNEFNVIYDSSNHETKCIIFLKTFIIVLMSILLIGILTYTIMNIVSFIISSCSLILQQIIYNYSRDYNLFSNILTVYKYNIKAEHQCWLCEKTMVNHKNIRKLNCTCNQSFHPECIEIYLSMYNNYCRNDHLISKFEHTA